jgi:aspartate aminotransferase-like enzyme
MPSQHPLFERLRIFAPGPTPVPEEVLSVMAKSPLHHRTKEFIAILDRVKAGLSFVFQTKQPSYVLSASGTGAMEACVVNLFSTNDKVLVINGGKFGERWLKLAKNYGLNVNELKVEWGNAAKPADVAAFLEKNPDTRGVLFQASETSTGVYHPVKEIADIVKQKSDALVVVDAITALGVSNLPMDAWGLDAVVSGSQKAFMLPPGLAFLSFSEKANAARKNSNLKKFYYNLDAEDKAALGGETAWTPAVSLVCGLDLVLQRMQKNGLEPIFQYHEKLATATREAALAMNLELFAKESPSNALTAILVPKTIPEGKKIISHLRDKYGITIAGGQDAWAGKMFRVAHLGYFDELDMLTMFSALEMTLQKLGHNLEPGKGVGKAQQAFARFA